MRRLAAIIALVLVCFTALAQTVSFWFEGWQRKPDAKQASEYFMAPGFGIYFTYQTNRVIVNTIGGGGTNYGMTTNFSVIFGDSSTHTLCFTNGLLMSIQ